MAPIYAPIPSASTPSLPLLSRKTVARKPSTDSSDLDHFEKGDLAFKEENESEEDDLDESDRLGGGIRDEGREGLLSGERKGVREDEEVLLVDAVRKRKDWLGKIRLPTLRSTLLLLLLGLSIALLGFVFHPSSPLKKYYHSDHLQPGTYSPDSILADNPLDPNGKFGDIPFAKLSDGGVPGGPTSSAVISETGASYKVESEKIMTAPSNTRRWNGTHEWDRTVLLVSLDGLRADYLEKGLTPNLLGIAKRGLRSEYLQPVFPSLTFPNHYSLITGLYPSSHGIVANDFYDPDLEDEFVYTDPARSWSDKWWGGEPIWSTAVKNGLKAAVLMWPGPPVMKDGIKPTFWFPFQNKFHYSKKIDKVAEWLGFNSLISITHSAICALKDLPLESRPQLILAYAPEIDQEGHRTGPHSHPLELELGEMDRFAAGLFTLLEERNATDLVDVVFVSDHGMTATHNERLVFLDDILGPEGFAGIWRNEGWPSAGLRFHPHINETEMLEKLLAASAEANGGFHVYTNETMPKRWAFTGHERIAPIYVIPHVGWAISDRHDYHVVMGGDYTPKGNHGYDNADPSMHAIFVAHGPFAEQLKSQNRKRQEVTPAITVIDGFPNLEIYNLVARLLGIEIPGRASNNGTVGFWDRYLY